MRHFYFAIWICLTSALTAISGQDATPSMFVEDAVKDFGKVTKGMDVVEKIEAVKTGVNKGMQDVPVDIVEIISVRVKK